MPALPEASSASVADLPAASRYDVFLAPHSDDICFSLGAFARRRRTGQLLTVFPVSRYSTLSEAGARHPEDITRLRLGEDAAFAARCGLRPAYLAFTDAGARGGDPFDPAGCAQLARQISRPLLAALAGPLLGMNGSPRPLLACPAGIGGHVDHLAVATVVAANLGRLQQRYRVGFYEDLHYASDPRMREAGLLNLDRLLGARVARRRTLDMDGEDCTWKMRLVEGYGSQLTPRLRSLRAFTPAMPAHDGPHEALWMVQPDMHQSSG